jgi:hypothetical protein
VEAYAGTTGATLYTWWLQLVKVRETIVVHQACLTGPSWFAALRRRRERRWRRWRSSDGECGKVEGKRVGGMVVKEEWKERSWPGA